MWVLCSSPECPVLGLDFCLVQRLGRPELVRNKGILRGMEHGKESPAVLQARLLRDSGEPPFRRGSFA